MIGKVMPKTVSLEEAARDLKELMAPLSFGETIIVTDADGKHIALLVSLRGATVPATVTAESSAADS
jgi:antitoxin (DNA-binding transcriptional repressor) of toxin-antitoxin stability system